MVAEGGRSVYNRDFLHFFWSFFYSNVNCYVYICRGTQLNCFLRKSLMQHLFTAIVSMDIASAFAATAVNDTC